MRALVMVTGATRGFGRAICREASRSTTWMGSSMPGVQVDWVLWGRSTEDIRQVAAEIRDQTPRDGGAIITGTECQALRASFDDAAFPDRVSEVMNFVRTACGAGAHDYAVLFNNAGSLGDPRPMRSVGGRQWLDEAQRLFRVNATSPALLASAFAECFRPLKETPGHRRTECVVIVYISTLAAIQEFESWSQYCSTKTAGEMMHRVLAQERPDVKFLAYSPGPLDTDMQRDVRERMLASSPTRIGLARMSESSTLIPPSSSAQVLLSLLKARAFQDGICRHVDFFDVR